MKKLIREVILLMVSVVVALLMGEIIVRIAVHSRNTKIPEIRPCNHEGFRDINHSTDNPDNAVRIAFLGDSYTVGQGLEFKDIFSSKIKDRLVGKNMNNPKIEVFNFGVMGANTPHELRILKRKVLKYRPNVYILGFVLNDFTSGTLKKEYYNQYRSCIRRYSIFRKFEPFSKLARFLDKKMFDLFSGFGKLQVEYLNSLYMPTENKEYKRMVNALDQILQIMAAEKGIVLFFPYFMRDEEKTYFYQKAKSIVGRECQKYKLPFIEITPYLKIKPYYKWWVSEQNHHPNAEAHSIIADVILRTMAQQKILPKVRHS